MAVFTVQLEDKVSGPAEDAATAVRGLSDEFERYQEQLSMVEQMQSASFAKHAQQQADIAREQQANLAAHSKGAYKGASEGDVMADVRKQQQAALARADADRDAAEGLRKQREEAEGVSKEFKALTASGDAASETLDSLALKAESVAGALAVGVAILTAYAAALWSLGKAAVALTQEKDQLEAVFDVLTGGAGGQLLDDLEDLASTLPFTADKLNSWAKSLLSAGISGDRLHTAIKAIASATAIMGEEGGRAAEGLIKRLEMTAAAGGKVAIDRRFLTQLGAAGVSVQALAKQLGVAPEKLSTMTVSAKQLGDAMQKALIAQGAGPLAKLGDTWGSISAKVSEGIDDAFEDLDELVGPFMAELRGIAAEFFAGSVASKDFAGGIRTVLKPAFEIATNFLHFLHLNFLRLQVAVLQARVWLKPVTSAFEQVGVSAGVVNVALYLLKGSVIVVAVVFGLLALAVALIASPFIIAATTIYGVVRAIGALIDLIGGAIANFDNLKNAASQAGTNMILGLGNAIQSGAAWVVGLVTGLAASIIGGITGPLKMRSPSRVMMQLGGYVTEGLAGGIDAGVPQVQASAQGAGMAAVQGGAQGVQAGGGAGANGGGGSDREIHVHLNGDIHIGAKDAPTTLEAFAQVLEQAAAMAGLGVPQGT